MKYELFRAIKGYKIVITKKGKEKKPIYYPKHKIRFLNDSLIPIPYLTVAEGFNGRTRENTDPFPIPLLSAFIFPL